MKTLLIKWHELITNYMTTITITLYKSFTRFSDKFEWEEDFVVEVWVTNYNVRLAVLIISWRHRVLVKHECLCRTVNVHSVDLNQWVIYLFLCFLLTLSAQCSYTSSRYLYSIRITHLCAQAKKKTYITTLFNWVKSSV